MSTRKKAFDDLINLALLTEIIALIFMVKFIRLSGLFFKAAFIRENAWRFNEIASSTADGKISNTIWENNSDKTSNLLKTAKIKYLKIKSKDGIKLCAESFINPKTTNKWVILIHGYSGRSEQMYSQAAEFFDMGYNVLLPDCRGHGKSGGGHICFGWYDRFDIISWAQRIIKAQNCAEIVLYGVSMGGAAVLMAGGEKLPENIKCIIEDCAYTSVKDELYWYLKTYLNLPSFPFINIADLICFKYMGFSLKEASAVNQVEKCKIPILFIHGGKDKFVPTYMVRKLYSKAICRKELYIVKNAGHGISSVIAGKKYWKKINEFLKSNLN